MRRLALWATPAVWDKVSSVLRTRTPAAAARATRSSEIGSLGTWAHSSIPASSASVAPSGPLRWADTMRPCAWASSTISIHLLRALPRQRGPLVGRIRGHPLGLDRRERGGREGGGK